MRFCGLLFLIAVLGGMTRAHADTLVLTGPGVADVFNVLPSPVPSAFSKDYGFSLYSVAGTDNGTPVVDRLIFLTSEVGGGLIVEGSEGNTINAFGSPLYTGTVGDPTFLLGSFDLTGLSSEYFLTISSTAAVTPEPASLVLLSPEVALAAVVFGCKYCQRRRAIEQ